MQRDLNKIQYSIILPTLNEQGHIIQLIYFIKKIFLHEKFEIIVIDDGSIDGTQEKLKKFSKKNSYVKFFLRNKNKPNLAESLNKGIRVSVGKNIIWMDADFSHPPNYLQNFIKESKNNKYDAIILSRYFQFKKKYDFYKAKSLISNLSFFLSLLCRLLIFKEITDYTSGFILIKNKTIKKIKLHGYYGEYFIYLVYDLLIKKKKIKEIYYQENKRRSGFSKTTSNKLDFLIKCFFILLSIIRCSSNKILKRLSKFIMKLIF